MRIGSFNFGIAQEMIDSTQWSSRWGKRFIEALGGILHSGEADLDLFFGCEVGGHLQGLKNNMLQQLASTCDWGFASGRMRQDYLSASTNQSMTFEDTLKFTPSSEKLQP